MRSFVPLSVLLVLAACTGDTTKTDDTATDDTGEVEIVYEEGCILVDGAGGYAHLADAYTVASEGSEIALCEGIMEIGLVIDKSVNIVGPGDTLLTWVAPVNEPAIRVEGAASVSIEGFSVSSTRNGIEVDGSSSVAIRDVVFNGIANTAIKSIDSTDVSVSNCTFTTPEFGGVEVQGGSAVIADSTFDAPVGFAVHALDSADVTVAGSQISGVTFSVNEDGSVTDGFALWATDDASLTTDGNVLADNFVAIFTDDAELALANDTITGGTYGVFAALGAMSFENMTVQDVFQSPFRAVTQDDVSLSGVTVTGDPELTNLDEYDFESFIGGGITLATSGTITLEDVLVENNNNNGLMVLGYGEEYPELTGERIILRNNARRALTMYSADAVFTDLSVEDTRLGIDPAEVTGNYNSQSPGLTVGLWTANVQWTGGGLSGSDDMGLINFQGVVTLEDFTLDGNKNIGLWNYQGTLSATASTFTAGSANSSINNRGGDLVLDGNSFENNLEVYHSESVDENGVVSATEYSNASQDVVCYEATSCAIRNNTFTDGSRGVQVSYSTEAVIENNTWLNYHSYLVYGYSNETGTVEVLNNAMTNVGANPFRCSTSTMNVEDLDIAGVVGAQVTYVYYTDGVETGGFSYTSTSPALYGYQCTLTFTDVTVADAESHGLYAVDTQLEVDGLEITGGSDSGSSTYGAFQATYNSVDPYLLVTDLTVDEPALGHGVQVNTSSALGAGVVLMDGVTVNNASGHGVSLSGVQDAVLSDISAVGSGGNGLNSTGSGLTLDIATLDNNTGYGLWVAGSDGSTQVTQASANSNGAGGLYLSATTASVTDNAFTANTTYGMTCDSTVTLSSCSNNDLTSNTLGEHDGCDDACSQR